MRTHALLMVVATFVAGSSFAQGREGRSDVFDRADANGDGLITRDEFRDARASQFDKRDRNSDGAMDDKDLGERAGTRARASKAMNGMIAQLDSNADGKVSKDEFVQGGTKVFDRADADNNSSLDAKEVEAAKAKRRERARR